MRSDVNVINHIDQTTLVIMHNKRLMCYGIKDGLGAVYSRAEVGDAHGSKKGSYTIADIDRRARRVDYVSDGLGFRATIKTHEPGTAASAPAAALDASPYARPVAPVVNHVAIAAPVAMSLMVKLSDTELLLVSDTEQAFMVPESLKLSSNKFFGICLTVFINTCGRRVYLFLRTVMIN
ncbi:hypothetical protein AVEN_244915-1 [Araneus ventricosus]|uniref:Uncharacterized protein n=1 Tax=Araneus ventricosus TaxID=182803 RepID=A0A4Y2QWM7_ARAVE|nr:hypothetical protein AVEN_168116-1 [Araneus ventricosus]GBN67505.1 hypothetical protein AVEN_226370-1 [Araneus ventricosus]GBN67519.1 hypothetical protein AVEN_244915-1 [Araneus ventricosus]